MENVRNFFEDMNSKISDDIEFFETDSNDEYRRLRSIDFQKIRSYRNKIADKLFSINKDDREIYAGLMLQEIDANNFGADLTQDEETIGDRTYKLYSIKNEHGEEELVDVSTIVDDCEFFVVWVFELFLSFNINMHDIIKKFDLLHDYSGFADLDKGEIKRYEERKENNENKREYKNKDFTASRQLLAIETILSEFGVIVKKGGKDSEGDIDKVSLAAFLQFMTNRQADSEPKNTNFYKMINDDDRPEQQNYKKDCDFVASHFKKIGLGELAENLLNGKTG